MKLRCLTFLMALASAATAAGGEFDDVVKAVESHYGTRRTHIPLMGVANLFVKVAHPAGTSSFQLAVFEDLRSSESDETDLDRFMDGLPTRGMHPLVRTHSRRRGESTYIFASEAGKWTKVLIATFERNEATVIEATVNLETLLKMANEPGVAGKMFGGRHDK